MCSAKVRSAGVCSAEVCSAGVCSAEVWVCSSAGCALLGVVGGCGGGCGGGAMAVSRQSSPSVEAASVRYTPELVVQKLRVFKNNPIIGSGPPGQATTVNWF